MPGVSEPVYQVLCVKKVPNDFVVLDDEKGGSNIATYAVEL